MTSSDPARKRGASPKYRLQVLGDDDFFHTLDDPFFPLRYTTDPHAAVALAAYATSCEADDHQLAADLRVAIREQPECECNELCCQWCEIHGDTGNSPITEHDPYHDDDDGIRGNASTATRHEAPMTLNWKSYGDRGRTAEGAQGVWRIVDGDRWWHLTLQPRFTRGMLNRGEFATRQDAEAHAQARENDVPILPQQIEATSAPSPTPGADDAER